MAVPHLNAVLIALDAVNNLKILKKEILKHCPEVSILATAFSIEQGRKMIYIHQPDIVFIEINRSFCSQYKKMEEFEPINYEIFYINNCPECPYHLVHHVPGEQLEYLTSPSELKMAVSRTINNMMLKHSQNGNSTIFIEPVK